MSVAYDGPSAAETAAMASRRKNGWLLSAPALFLLAIAAIGPLFVVIAFAFMAPGDYSGVRAEFSLNAWLQILFQKDIFDDTWSIADAHLTIFWRSVKLSLTTTLLTLVFGFPTAYFIATRPVRHRAFWLFAITLPFWTNLLIRTFAIMEVLRYQGVANTVMIKLGLIPEPLQMLYTDGAVLLGMTYVYLPLMVLPLYATIDRFDFRLVEAGYDLYASRLQVLRRVIVPLCRPGLVAGSILVFVPSLGAYVTPRVLGGGKKMMLGNFIELQFGQGRNWPLGAALALVLLAIVLAALLVYTRAQNAGNRGGEHG